LTKRNFLSIAFNGKSDELRDNIGKASLSSGDVLWSENRDGILDEALIPWPDCGLEQEKW